MISCKSQVLIHSHMGCGHRCQRGREKGPVLDYGKPMWVWTRNFASRVMKFVLSPACSWFMLTLSVSSSIAWDQFGCSVTRKLFLCSISPLGQSWMVPWCLLSNCILTYFRDSTLWAGFRDQCLALCRGSKWRDQVTPQVSFFYCRNASGSGSSDSSEALSHHQKCPGSLQWAGEWWLTCLLR